MALYGDAGWVCLVVGCCCLPGNPAIMQPAPTDDTAATATAAAAAAAAGQKYHSVVLRPQQPVTDTAIFTSFRTADGRCGCLTQPCHQLQLMHARSMPVPTASTRHWPLMI
jgi:hypothetical protein